jgi:hypothetical protein
MSNVMNLLKQRHHPEQYAAEQAEADRKHQETLAFIEGAKAALEEVEKSKATPFFVSDYTSPIGFKPASK